MALHAASWPGGREEGGLAPCATASAQTRGRVHPEPPDPLRTAFEVDRHRILTCTAFRRVRSKTQVFAGASGDHIRTRLTHTLEVAEIARLLSAALRANATLAQTIALAHDLGHPPFGHAGEAALADLMRDHGGFEHNAHALRVVDFLEHPYPAFRGLNLTYDVREGLIKHVTRYDRPAADAAAPAAVDYAELLSSGPQPALEAQIVAAADRLAYDLHDLEDAIGAGLLHADHLQRLEWWNTAFHERGSAAREASIHAVRRPVLDGMLDRAAMDLAATTSEAIAALTSPDDVRRRGLPVVSFSALMDSQIRQAEDLLLREVYQTAHVRRMDDEARRLVTALFAAYLRRPDALPPRFRARVDELGAHRVICDYIAGMTDRFCEAEWARLCTCNSA